MAEEANELLEQLRELAESKTIEELMAENSYDYEVAGLEGGVYRLEMVWRDAGKVVWRRSANDWAEARTQRGYLMLSTAFRGVTRIAAHGSDALSKCAFVADNTGSAYLVEKIKLGHNAHEPFGFSTAQAAAEILSYEEDREEDSPSLVSEEVIEALTFLDDWDMPSQEMLWSALSELDPDWYDGWADLGGRPTQQYVDACLIARAVTRYAGEVE